MDDTRTKSRILIEFETEKPDDEMHEEFENATLGGFEEVDFIESIEEWFDQSIWREDRQGFKLNLALNKDVEKQFERERQQGAKEERERIYEALSKKIIKGVWKFGKYTDVNFFVKNGFPWDNQHSKMKDTRVIEFSELEKLEEGSSSKKTRSDSTESSSERGSSQVKTAYRDLALEKPERINRHERDAVKKISVSPDTTPAKRPKGIPVIENIYPCTLEGLRKLKEADKQ